MDKTVRLWDMETKICLQMFAHNDYGKNFTSLSLVAHSVSHLYDALLLLFILFLWKKHLLIIIFYSDLRSIQPSR